MAGEKRCDGVARSDGAVPRRPPRLQARDSPPDERVQHVVDALARQGGQLRNLGGGRAAAPREGDVGARLAGVRGHLAGEPQAQPVLAEQRPAGGAQRGGFVVPQPGEERGGAVDGRYLAGQRQHPGR